MFNGRYVFSLRNNPIIRSLVAALLLIIFAGGITPSKTFHDIIASHEVDTKKVSAVEGNQLSAEGFDCKCNDLVALSPYIGEDSFDYAGHLALAYPTFFSTLKFQIYSSVPIYSSLRGPPTNG